MTSGQGKVQLLSTIGLVMCLFLAGTPANVSFAQETFAGVPARNRHITKPIVDSSCTFPCPDVIACSAFPGSPSPARGLACTTILQLHQGTILEAAKAVACPFCTPAYLCRGPNRSSPGQKLPQSGRLLYCMLTPVVSMDRRNTQLEATLR